MKIGTNKELLQKLELNDVLGDLFNLVATEGQSFDKTYIGRDPIYFVYIVKTFLMQYVHTYRVFKLDQLIVVSNLIPSFPMLL